LKRLCCSDDKPEHVSIGFRRRQAKRKRAKAFLAGNPLLVGIDLAKRHHAAWIAGRDLTPIRRFMVAHNHEGLETLLRRVERDRGAGGFDRVIAFMEPTSHFWENVANFLEAQGIAYRTVSPLAVCRQREIEHITFAKGDYRDAELILRLGAQGQWLYRTSERDPLWRRLRALANEHETLLVYERQECLRIQSLLELVLPEFFEYLADPFKKTAWALLVRLSHPAAEIPTTFKEVRQRISMTRGYRLHRTKLRALAARLEAAPTYGVEPALASSLERIGLGLDRLQLVRDQLEDVRTRLVALYHQTPYQKVLDTIPGVRQESQALLLALTGDPARYDRATCLVKLAGTEPRENHSGQAEGSHSISHRGRASLRYVLFRITMGLRSGNPEIAAYIERLCNRTNNPLKWTQALVAAGNKYLRLVYRLCVDGKPYDRSKLLRRD